MEPIRAPLSRVTSRLVLPQASGGRAASASAIVSVCLFDPLANRFVGDGQVPWLRAPQLLCPLVEQFAIRSLAGLALLRRSRDVAFGDGNEAVNLVTRQRHGRACGEIGISGPLPHLRRFAGSSRPSPRRQTVALCRATSSFSPTARPLPASQLFSAWSCFSQGQRKSPAPRSQTLSLPPNQPPLKPC